MHDVLRDRLIRKIESLPDEQVYQVLDYIEFLESKYVTADGVTTSGLQRFAEGLEDKLRRRAVSPNTIREAFQLISAADRVLSGVSSAGRQILGDLGQVLDVEEDTPASPPTETESSGSHAPVHDDAQRIEADPRKRRSSAGKRGPANAGKGRTEPEPRSPGASPTDGASPGGGAGDSRAKATGDSDGKPTDGSE